MGVHSCIAVWRAEGTDRFVGTLHAQTESDAAVIFDGNVLH